MTPSTIQLVATAFFAAAVLHTFFAKQLHHLGRSFPRHAGLFHLLGEVEVVFGFWAMLLVLAMALLSGGKEALQYAESREFGEPLFVFVVMVIAGTRPVVFAVRRAIEWMAHVVPLPTAIARVWLALAIIPLFGSFITEPAAMTIAALLLAPQVFHSGVPQARKYLVLGVLFVNVSIGGTLTSFAAPPVLMVTDTWGWTSSFMAATFGWRAAIAVVINANFGALAVRGLLAGEHQQGQGEERPAPPRTLTLLHFAFLAAVVVLSHHPVAFIGVFLLFLGVSQAYESHQDALIVRDALLVAFFLAGLVVLGGLQDWWLRPIIGALTPHALFGATAALTAITDNAALTYLGSLVEGLNEEARYMLVAGAVAGGGLTVIANAPNPAGAALLRHGFDDESIGVLGLLAGAALPTAVAIAAFLLR
jgi:hypothetical protein